MTAAEKLYAAATRMRETATDTTPGNWQVGNGDTIGLDIQQTSRSSFSYGAQFAQVLDTLDREDDNEGAHQLGDPEADANWIALVDPRLAGPLPDLLEAVAGLIEANPPLEGQHPDGQPCDDLACRILVAAVSIADLILGGTE